MEIRTNSLHQVRYCRICVTLALRVVNTCCYSMTLKMNSVFYISRRESIALSGQYGRKHEGQMGEANGAMFGFIMASKNVTLN